MHVCNHPATQFNVPRTITPEVFLLQLAACAWALSTPPLESLNRIRLAGLDTVDLWPNSFDEIGSADAITSRGFTEPEVIEVSEIIISALSNHTDTSLLGQLADQVKNLASSHPVPGID